MIVLTLPYPVSANRYWATRVVPGGKGKRAMAVTYVTAEAKEYRDKVARICRDAGVLKPIRGRVETGLQIFPHRPLDWKTRMRKLGAAWDDSVQCVDIDNVPKVLFDSIKGLVITDDGWEHRRMLVERMEPDGQARVVLYVRPMPVAKVQEVLL